MSRPARRQADRGHAARSPWQWTREILRELGPGLITGAADDDPSGIATYSQAGAVAGFGLLWAVILTTPLMIAIQEISARIAAVTERGLAANFRAAFPGWITGPAIAALVVANVFNVGADLLAMGSAAQMLFGGPALLWTAIAAAVAIGLAIILPYRPYVSVLKWTCLVLLTYVVVGVAVRPDAFAVTRGTFIPSLAGGTIGLLLLVAVLGTTISPYLFFWQASLEADEARHWRRPLLASKPKTRRRKVGAINRDTVVGMIVSNLIAFFIVVATAATLYGRGGMAIATASDAAAALRPVARGFAAPLFAAGIVGTGLIAVPALAGSAGLGIAEVLGQRASLDHRFSGAPVAYGAFIASAVLGILLIQGGVNVMQALVYASVLNGFATVPIMVLILLLASRGDVMGSMAISKWLQVMGWAATAVMALTSLALLAVWMGI
ncbi:MAG: NRAMP family divalent metal transporter [Thermoplasmatota archaeon]